MSVQIFSAEDDVLFFAGYINSNKALRFYQDSPLSNKIIQIKYSNLASKLVSLTGSFFSAFELVDSEIECWGWGVNLMCLNNNGETSVVFVYWNSFRSSHLI